MITTIDLRGRSSIADLMIVATGRSSRHLGSMADHLIFRVKQGGFAIGRIEGKEDGNWVLVDTGDIIIHLFQPDVRAFYNLEKLWMDPTLTPSSDAKPKKAAAPKKKKEPAKAALAKKIAAPKKAPVRKSDVKTDKPASDAKKITAEEMGNINRLKARAKKTRK